MIEFPDMDLPEASPEDGTISSLVLSEMQYGGYRCALPAILQAFGTGKSRKAAALDLAFMLEQQARAVRELAGKMDDQEEE